VYGPTAGERGRRKRAAANKTAWVYFFFSFIFVGQRKRLVVHADPECWVGSGQRTGKKETEYAQSIMHEKQKKKRRARRIRTRGDAASTNAVGKEPACRKKLQRLQFSRIVRLWTLELPVFAGCFFFFGVVGLWRKKTGK